MPLMRQRCLLRQRLPLIGLLAFSAAIYLSACFQPALLDDADATHAQAAKEMLQRHDWVTLHVNGVRYLEKAPLLYWLVAISYRLFGINQFAVRVPTALAVVLLAWMMYAYGRWAYSARAGWYAAAISTSCVGMFLFTRIMIPEAWLTLFCTVAHYCFGRAFFGSDREKRLYYGCYAAMALAVLTKGLIGMVFIMAPICGFFLLTRCFAEWRQLRLGSGLAVFLAIAAPWHLLASWRNAHFFWFYFINEHVLRFLGLREPKDYNKVPFLSYWLLHLAWLFPWSVGLPLLVRHFPRGLRPAVLRPAVLRTTDRQALITLYLWLWAGSILLFFSLSTSQEYYTFPAYAPLALLLGLACAAAEEHASASRYWQWAQGVLVGIAVILAALLIVLVWQSRHVPVAGDLSELLNLAPADAERYTFSLGHFFDLTPQAFAALRGPALATAVVLSAGFLLAFGWRWQRRHRHAAAAMLVTMGLLFLCANRALMQFEPVLSSRPLADAILRRWEPGAKVIINGEYESGSALGFYTDQPILLLHGRVTGMAFGSTYPDVPPVFLEDEDVRRLWSGPERIFLFTENTRRETLLNTLQMPVIEVAEQGGKSVLTNKPW
jgi:4-amino-4-deoxy-L-arabinose transferase-like glycosyltransferase